MANMASSFPHTHTIAGGRHEKYQRPGTIASRGRVSLDSCFAYWNIWSRLGYSVARRHRARPHLYAPTRHDSEQYWPGWDRSTN